MNEQETIADIITEKRRVAERIRNSPSTVPVRQWDQQAEIKSLEDEANRLEAAHKREMSKCVAVGNQRKEARSDTQGTGRV